MIQANLTKVTSTVTARQALVEDEPDENDSQNAREVIAGAREQVDISLKQIHTYKKTTTESHVKNERNTCNHLQRGTQLQNAAATASGQEEILEASQQNKKLQRTSLTWICQAKHSSEEANEPATQQRTEYSENEESS